MHLAQISLSMTDKLGDGHEMSADRLDAATSFGDAGPFRLQSPARAADALRGERAFSCYVYEESLFATVTATTAPISMAYSTMEAPPLTASSSLSCNSRASFPFSEIHFDFRHCKFAHDPVSTPDQYMGMPPK